MYLPVGWGRVKSFWLTAPPLKSLQVRVNHCSSLHLEGKPLQLTVPRATSQLLPLLRAIPVFLFPFSLFFCSSATDLPSLWGYFRPNLPGFSLLHHLRLLRALLGDGTAWFLLHPLCFGMLAEDSSFPGTVHIPGLCDQPRVGFGRASASSCWRRF